MYLKWHLVPTSHIQLYNVQDPQLLVEAHLISKCKMFLRVSSFFAVLFFLFILEENILFAFQDDFINDFEVDDSIKQKENIKSLTLPGKLIVDSFNQV